MTPREIADELSKPLDARHVKTRSQAGQTLSYVEGWHAIAEANRIFGWDAWSRDTLEMREVRSELVGDKHRVAFFCRVRIHVGGIFRDGCGYGSGIAKDLGDAYESALKEAETDAMKRALMTFGNPFGLALYDKTKANVDHGESHKSSRPAGYAGTGNDRSTATVAGAAVRSEKLSEQATAAGPRKATDPTPLDLFIGKLNKAKNLSDLQVIWTAHPADLQRNQGAIRAKDRMKGLLAQQPLEHDGRVA